MTSSMTSSSSSTINIVPVQEKPRRQMRFSVAALLLPAVILYAVLFVWPLFNTLWASLTPDNVLSPGSYTEFFDSAFYRSILWRSVRISLMTTVATVIIGYPIAVYLSQPWRRARGLVTMLVIAPMLVSAVVRSYGWIIILGPNGVLGKLLTLLGLPFANRYLLYSEPGVIIALTHVFLPFMVLAITGKLQQIDPAMARASQSLGATRLQTFLRVILPLSMPGVTAGAVIVFCLSASGFVTPALIGGSTIPVMPYLVYKQGMLVLNWSFASAVAIILLVVTAAITALYSVWAKNSTRWSAS